MDEFAPGLYAAAIQRPSAGVWSEAVMAGKLFVPRWTCRHVHESAGEARDCARHELRRWRADYN